MELLFVTNVIYVLTRAIKICSIISNSMLNTKIVINSFVSNLSKKKLV